MNKILAYLISLRFQSVLWRKNTLKYIALKWTCNGHMDTCTCIHRQHVVVEWRKGIAKMTF